MADWIDTFTINTALLLLLLHVPQYVTGLKTDLLVQPMTRVNRCDFLQSM